MKTKNFRSVVNLKFLLVLPVIALLIFTLASCGKAKKSEAVLTEIAPTLDSALTVVDELPLFNGGDTALLKYIAENTVYPEEAKKNNIMGRVIIKLIVEKDCSVSNVEVLKGVDSLLDAEAVRVVSSLPKFEKPGKNAGEIVRVNYMIPIVFTLK
jgi:TonB family protein